MYAFLLVLVNNIALEKCEDRFFPTPSKWLIYVTSHLTPLLFVLQDSQEKLPLPSRMPCSHCCKHEILLLASKGVQNILIETPCWFLLKPSATGIISASSLVHKQYSLLLAALLSVGVWVLFPSSQKLDYVFLFLSFLIALEQLHRREGGKYLHLVITNFLIFLIFFTLKSISLTISVRLYTTVSYL